MIDNETIKFIDWVLEDCDKQEEFLLQRLEFVREKRIRYLYAKEHLYDD